LRVQELAPRGVWVPGAIFRALRTRQRVEAATEAELEQLALDPLVFPGVVLGGEPFDDRCGLGADWQSSHPMQVGPLPGD